jgi:hypothetical protein
LELIKSYDSIEAVCEGVGEQNYDERFDLAYKTLQAHLVANQVMRSIRESA